MYSRDYSRFRHTTGRRRATGHARDRRRDGDRPRGHVDHAGGRDCRPADTEVVRDRFTEGIRLVPALPGRNRRPPRLSSLVHHLCRRRHQGPDRKSQTDVAPPRRHGALPLRSSTGPRQLSGQRPLRAAGHGRRARRHRNTLRTEGRRSPGPAERHQQPVLHLRSDDVHRVLAMRARVRRDAGYVCADDPGARIRVQGLGESERTVPRLRMRLVRRLRRGVPDRRPDRKYH